MKSMFGIKRCALSDYGICTALKGRNTATMGLAHRTSVMAAIEHP